MSSDATAVATILGMAVATYATRAGGLWVVGRIPTSHRVEAWLQQIPGVVLISIIAPTVFTHGLVSLLASLVTVAVAVKTRQILPAMVVGIVTISILRAYT